MAVTLTWEQLRDAVRGHRALSPVEDSGAQNAVHGPLDDDTTAERVHAVVTALVDQEAPGAPESVQDEAAVRAAAWIADDLRPVGALSVSEDRSATSIGEGSVAAINRNVTYHRGQSVLRLSGARALLAPWRRRSVGPCVEAES